MEVAGQIAVDVWGTPERFDRIKAQATLRPHLRLSLRFRLVETGVFIRPCPTVVALNSLAMPHISRNAHQFGDRGGARATVKPTPLPSKHHEQAPKLDMKN